MATSDLDKQVQEIKEKIKELQKELFAIKEGCKHEDYKIDFIEERGFKTLARVCRNCDKSIGYPSDSEIKDSGFS